MDNKILDCTMIDDEAFEVLSKTVADMSNGIPHVIAREKFVDRAMQAVYDYGVLSCGLALTAAGGIMYIYDRYKLNKLITK